MMGNLGQEYLDTVIKRVKYYKDLADRTFAQLATDEEFYYRPNEESNSIALIIQHMSGNMLSRWTNFLTDDGEKDWRDRDAEFEIHSYSRQQLIEMWNKGWDCYLDALASLQPDDLLKSIYIRKETMTAIDAINRQLAHYPYHIGQILFLGKIIRNENWKNLSIPRGSSKKYNQGDHIKDPAKNFSR